MRKEHRNLLPKEQSSSFQHTLVKVTKNTLDCIFLVLLYSYFSHPHFLLIQQMCKTHWDLERLSTPDGKVKSTTLNLFGSNKTYFEIFLIGEIF